MILLALLVFTVANLAAGVFVLTLLLPGRHGGKAARAPVEDEEQELQRRRMDEGVSNILAYSPDIPEVRYDGSSGI